MPALITTDDFRALRLGLKGVKSMPENEELEVLLATASENIEDTLDRKLGLQARSDVFRGNDSYRFMTREYPLVSVTSVAWEDEGTGQTGTHDASLFAVEDYGAIRWKMTGVEWFRDTRWYTVTYQAGYDTLPGPLKHAIALQTTVLMQPNFLGPGTNQAELIASATQQIVDLIDPYRRRAFRA